MVKDLEKWAEEKGVKYFIPAYSSKSDRSGCVRLKVL